jgi:hypothetical protein
MNKYGFVYIWFDRKDRRFYIGCHWGRIEDGYVCSSPWMKRAYTHRPHDFKRKILKTNLSSRLLTYEEELRWLNMIKLNEAGKKYYNLNVRNNEMWSKYDDHIKTIGQKISASPNRRANISKANKGKKRTQATKDKIRAMRLGTTLSEETKRKISENHNRDYTDLEFRRKMSIVAKSRSPETRKLISENNKRLVAEGRIGMLGKKHSIETKMKMSITARRRAELKKSIQSVSV